MTIEEAISHCQEVVNTCENNECVLDHKQLIEWLQELQQLRADKEKIRNEQHEEDITKAFKWLLDNAYFYIDYAGYFDDKALVANFVEAMKK